MNIDKHPIHRSIYNLCLEIESLPASEQQTKVLLMASELHKTVDKLVDALNLIASWSEGEKVTPSFDEPCSAALARGALTPQPGADPICL